jgi:hypothetical protein
MSSITGNQNPSISAATKLRRVINSPNGYVFAPGVYDGLSARTALEVGFDCLYMVRLPIHLGMESLRRLTGNISYYRLGQELLRPALAMLISQSHLYQVTTAHKNSIIM